MTESSYPIDLNLSEKMADAAYRKVFILADASSRIASDLISLRKRRGLSQKELADLINVHQSTISIMERLNSASWSFSTLCSIVAALDARIRITIQPSEDE